MSELLLFKKLFDRTKPRDYEGLYFMELTSMKPLIDILVDNFKA